jgi:hypothetical protein
MPSTKAVGGGIYSGVFSKDVKVPVTVTRRSLLVPLLPTVGCLIDCLGFDLFLMTKELCSLLLSPCLNKVSCGREGRITCGGDGGADPGRAR